MIVNPQFFNYRLIVGSLTILVVALSVVSLINYQSITAHQEFLEQEKKFVERELVEMIDQYDEVSLSNNTISDQLIESKRKAQLALDSLRIMNSNISLLSRYKQQVVNLKVKNKILFQAIDSLEERNKDLKEQNLLVFNELLNKETENETLKKENEKLNKDLKYASKLNVSSFKAKGYQKAFGIKSLTTKAKHVNSIEVCFTIKENKIIKKGEKDLYIQILDPRNNIIADKGLVSFDENSLIYSEKVTVNYNNFDYDLCLNVQAEKNEQPLVPGTYFVSAFHDGQKLGSTQIEFR